MDDRAAETLISALVPGWGGRNHRTRQKTEETYRAKVEATRGHGRIGAGHSAQFTQPFPVSQRRQVRLVQSLQEK